MNRKPLTVAEACSLRNNCRYGLRGVRMRHVPTGREFACGGSEWDPREELLVYVGETPEEEIRAVVMAAITKVYGEGSAEAREATEDYDRLGIMGSQVLFAAEFPSPETLPAADCVLLSRWPVVCCKPRRWRRAAP